MKGGPYQNTDRVIVERFDRRASEYDEQSLWVNDPEIEEALLSGFQPGVRVLEAAGGTGAVTAAAVRRGAWTVCSDISHGMLTQARAKCLRTDRAFDIVVIRQGLQYAVLPIAFAEFRRVAALQIRTAQIVTRDETERALWAQIFSALGQDNRVVFCAGTIEAAAAALGLRKISQINLRRVERLISPNLIHRCHHINLDLIEDLIRQIDPQAARDGSDWLHTVRWEILHMVAI